MQRTVSSPQLREQEAESHGCTQSQNKGVPSEQTGRAATFGKTGRLHARRLRARTKSALFHPACTERPKGNLIIREHCCCRCELARCGAPAGEETEAPILPCAQQGSPGIS